MGNLDWFVIGLYFLCIIVFALFQIRKQSSIGDYYLAGRNIKWWQSGFSTMATQLGAISFVSAPAFVALKEGGGLKWLCYEFGVPLGVLAVIIWIIPILHRDRYVSIYEYLEKRFDRGTRTLVSLLFQIGRGLATAVSILAGGLILSTATPLSTTSAIILIGAVTIIYDALGGMRAVIFSDVAQMLIICAGIVICGLTALSMVGWSAAWQSLDPDRLRILDFTRLGISSEGEYSFWPMAIGGIFLYASYYGCDQSQVQRELSVGSMRGVRKSLLLNAFGRFPIVLLYCLMGVFVGAVFSSPAYLGQIAQTLGMSASDVGTTLQADPDRMVPMFILTFLPAGIVGLLIVAIMSALMSSLDSAINSLSAVTMQDFYRVYIKPSASDRHYLIVSKLLTVFWGIFCIAAALQFAHVAEATRQTTIVLINAVGSLLYGPILAAFFIGMASRRIQSLHIKAGIVIGIVANIVLWRMTDISWLWWNAAGFVVTLAVSILLYYMLLSPDDRKLSPRIFRKDLGYVGTMMPSHVSVIIYLFLIIVIAHFIQTMGS
jgi:SSS family transporter